MTTTTTTTFAGADDISPPRGVASRLTPRDLSPALSCAAEDYGCVRRALAYLSEHWREQPDVAAVADAAGLSADALTVLFRRWAGLTPKAFLQAITLNHARALLRQSASVLDAAYEVGLSGPGRLHDLFVTHEAMSPGEWKAGGAGLCLQWAFHPSPFGSALVMVTGRGLAGLAFADAGQEQAVLAEMQGRWPRATYVHDTAGTAPFVRRIFDPAAWRSDRPLRIVLIGTDFEVRVWETLLRVPLGSVTSFSDVAAQVCSKKAARAVGTAIGRNPICFVVPCHRVIGKDGSLTGYHWGLTRKRAILGWEAGQIAMASSAR